MTTNYRLETDDWKLTCYLDWEAKQHVEECGDCHGSGERSAGRLGWIDDDEKQCSTCHGRGTVTRGPKTFNKPEIPPAILEHMRRAWWDYFHKGG